MVAPLGGMGAPHRPVLLQETISLLQPEHGGLFVDGTLGLGGHSEALLLASPETSVVGLDRDREALGWGTERLASFGSRFRAVHADYRDIKRVLAEMNIERVRGVLVDLGVSSLQFDSATRGFSFRTDAPLDMRMDARWRRRDGG